MSKYPSFRITLFVVALSAYLNISCNPEKNTTYFQTIPYNSEVQTLITKDFEPRVKPDDILDITIVSPSQEVKDYNAAPEGYLVDKNGNIQMFKLGEVKVLDLTLSQIKTKITQMLVPDIFKQVGVSVRFKNHRVVVIGEVNSAGVIPMPTEHLSIVEAIAIRGDLRETARKDNILIIRNTEKGKMFHRVNLLDGSVFNSPFYYLQSDDIIYVEKDPDKSKAGKTQQYIGFIFSGLSLAFLIFDRFTR